MQIKAVYQRPATNICFMDLANKPPNTAPAQGASTGTHAYHHSDGPFPGIGSIQCANLGAKSRAGFRAGPVVPPPHKIRTKTRKPIRSGCKPVLYREVSAPSLMRMFPWLDMEKAPYVSRNVRKHSAQKQCSQ
jgi:hypothetical protein